MNKKVIALSLVIVLLATTFAACGKKPTIEINGNEYILVTDEEGNTVLNERGEILVYPTEENGEHITDSNGETQVAGVKFPELIVNDRTLETPHFKITYPETWSVDDKGKATRNENDKTYIKIYNLGELDKGETLDSYVAKKYEDIIEFGESAKEVYPDTTYGMAILELTEKNVKSIVTEMKIVKDDGSVLCFTQVIYFVHNDCLFKFEYISNEGGYYEDVIPWEIMDTNLILKDIKTN